MAPAPGQRRLRLIGRPRYAGCTYGKSLPRRRSVAGFRQRTLDWNCKGGGSGITVSCSAPLAENAEIPPAREHRPAQKASPEVPPATEKAGNECTPTVKRWTITCQQGGYPANYTGVIVGETQVLCPDQVGGGMLSNSCFPPA